MVDVTFTLDLEDHRPAGFEQRYPEVTNKVLAFCNKHDIQATVFVLGRVARESPELIKQISTQGHEVAYHTEDHIHLTKENTAAFYKKSEAGKKYLEDLTGKAVSGFRAPAFSLVKQSLWAVDTIHELGFKYSSSVLPVANPINGFPGTPRKAFYWPNGLLEIPAPIMRLGPMEIPYLGGFYLRYLPKFLLCKELRNNQDEQSKWIYCHPHDFDYGEPYYTIEGTSILTSLLLWFNRKHTFEKLEALIQHSEINMTHCFIEQIKAGNFNDASTFRMAS